MNEYKMTLDLDRKGRNINPAITHRIGDVGGTTLTASIFDHGIIPSGLTSPLLVANLPDGSVKSQSASINNRNVVSADLDQTFNNVAGTAKCHFEFGDIYSTEDFNVELINGVYWTDDDLIWGNSNFKNKVVGDDNPNIIGRTKVALKKVDVIFRGNHYNWSGKYINSDIFANKEDFHEIDQKFYDALKDGFWGKQSTLDYPQTEKQYDSNYLEIVNNSYTGTANTSAIGASDSIPLGERYPIFARLKVPMNAKKIVINNIFTSPDLDINKNKDERVRVYGMADLKSNYLTIFDENYNAEIYRISDNDGKTYDEKGNVYMSSIQKTTYNLPGIKYRYGDDGRIIGIEVDLEKCNLVDKYGYIDFIEGLEALNTTLMNTSIFYMKMFVYPHINIDYATLPE